MGIPLAAVDWPEVVTTVIALAAFGLSVLSLLLQRKRPYLEGQILGVHPHVAVAIRNSGDRTARAPWVMFAAENGEAVFWDHAGAGFLPPESGRILTTDATITEIQRVVGVVGYVDRKGNHVVRALDGSYRHKRFKQGTTFEAIFLAFYPDQTFGVTAVKTSDKPID